MLTLYGVSRSRASRNLWLLHELGMPFRQVPVIQANRLADPAAADAPLNTRSPAFLKINPNGRVPALEDDGLVMCESLAMNLYIAKKAGGPLAPSGLAEDALMTMWAIWAATELEPHAVQIMYHRAMKPPAERDPKIVDAAIATLRAPFDVLEAALRASPHLVGGRFTVADINTAEIVRYATFSPELMDTHPKVKAWLAACHAREAFKKMMAAREAEPA